MAALTGNYEANQKPGALIAYNVGAAKHIFRGSLVVTDDATGYAEPGADAGGKSFCGVAYEPADNSVGAAGDVGVRVHKTGSYVYDFSGGAPTQAVVGKKAYLIDDHTVALVGTAVSDVFCGVIVGLVGSSQVRVRIDAAVL
jgi:hypothetical protein